MKAEHRIVRPLEDGKNRYFWILPTHFCVSIQKFDGFLDTFGYSQPISEPVSKILGACPPLKILDTGSEISWDLGVSINI